LWHYVNDESTKNIGDSHRMHLDQDGYITVMSNFSSCIAGHADFALAGWHDPACTALPHAIISAWAAATMLAWPACCADATLSRK
jgi:hypothetical protein